MKYCRYCGKQIDEDSAFCTHCGKSQTSVLGGHEQEKGLTQRMAMLFSSLRNFKRQIKFPRLNLQSKLIHKLCLWSKRLVGFVLIIGVGYILIASATWVYYVLQESKWESQDNAFINAANNNNTIDIDSVLSFIDLEEQHYERDWFDILHKCSINHKNEIVAVLNDLAEKGSLNAQLLLGRYYKSGSFHPFKETKSINCIDKDKSSYWFYLAAEQGNAEAQGELGHNYKYGIGVTQNFEKAFYWLQKGAKNGDAVAQWRLGNIYAYGLGYYTKYFSDSNCHTWWYTGTNFASAGDSKETISNNECIKEMHQTGPNEVIVPKDIKKALYYWRLASDQGIEEAKENLQKIYDVEEIDTLDN